MKEKFIRAYLQTAATFAELSSARRLKVGAIIVKDNRIISIGYNGMPAGWDNNCEYEDIGFSDTVFGESQTLVNRGLKTRPEVLHAERNALDKLARDGGIGGSGASLFSTHAPCLECAKSIYGSGIKEVYYKEDYRSNDGIEFLQKCNITVNKINS